MLRLSLTRISVLTLITCICAKYDVVSPMDSGKCVILSPRLVRMVFAVLKCIEGVTGSSHLNS